MRLYRTPTAEIDRKKTKLTLVATVNLVVCGCVKPFVMQHWYVHPCQAGTGETFNTFTWTAVYITLGLTTAKIICDEYNPGAKIRNA